MADTITRIIEEMGPMTQEESPIGPDYTWNRDGVMETAHRHDVLVLWPLSSSGSYENSFSPGNVHSAVVYVESHELDEVIRAYLSGNELLMENSSARAIGTVLNKTFSETKCENVVAEIMDDLGYEPYPESCGDRSLSR